MTGTESEPRSAEWAWLGSVPYLSALTLQESIRDGVAAGNLPETLLLLEHEPVITLGRHVRPEHMLASPRELARAGIAVVHTSRGGDVTFHGPGQLVGYPVFRLRGGIKAHVAAMVSGIVASLAELGIAAEWRAARPGIWVGNDKICAVGVHVRRRVAVHGFALNASVALAGFDNIVPCGLADAGVTSIVELLGAAPTLADLATRVARAFAASFDMRMVRIPSTSSRLQTAFVDR